MKPQKVPAKSSLTSTCNFGQDSWLPAYSRVESVPYCLPSYSFNVQHRDQMHFLCHLLGDYQGFMQVGVTCDDATDYLSINCIHKLTRRRALFCALFGPNRLEFALVQAPFLEQYHISPHAQCGDRAYRHGCLSIFPANAFQDSTRRAVASASATNIARIPTARLIWPHWRAQLIE